MLGHRFVSLFVVSSVLTASAARAATGVCDSSTAASQSCLDAVQNAGGLVNEVFHDANGLDAYSLPLMGTLFNNWPGCDTVNATGCAGQSLSPYDCPGQYSCTSTPNSFANASTLVANVDRRWVSPCRLADHTLTNSCPAWSSCVADGTPGSYYPWEGLVFDLGASANQVVLFAALDHGPEPCESLEYTVFLSDNPFSVEEVLDPSTSGVDPNRWNRAHLARLYSKGWVEVRSADPTGHGSCGDTALFSVEMDAMAPVFALPPGARMRYAAIVAGNDGLDFAECGFDSSDAELDAVAGLDESRNALCPDADHDLYGDCNCPTAGAVCDCNDADPAVHPGAPESCDSIDSNCNGSFDDTCTALDECHTVGTCDQSTGVCSNPPVSDGTACTAGTCTAGVCVPAGAGGNGGANGIGGAAGATSVTGGASGASVTGGANATAGTGGASASGGAPGGNGGAAATSGKPSSSGTPGGCSCRTSSSNDSETGVLWLAWALLFTFAAARSVHRQPFCGDRRRAR